MSLYLSLKRKEKRRAEGMEGGIRRQRSMQLTFYIALLEVRHGFQKEVSWNWRTVVFWSENANLIEYIM